MTIKTHFTTELKNKVMIIHIFGTLIVSNSLTKLDSEIKKLLSKDFKNFILDLTKVTHINSSGLGVLIYTHSESTSVGGKMVIAGAKNEVVTLLNKTRVCSLFECFKTVEDALKEFPPAKEEKNELKN
jgi:anti-anti-sigma factor